MQLPDVVKVLAGNKCECLPAQRMVEKERGDRIAENFDMPFFEVSCKNNINIEESFLTLARQIREQREHRGENFDNDGTQEKKSGSGSGTGLGPFTLGNSPDSNRCSC
ncbi:hypothetical protein HA402_001956 [Bradysia odoriphaga]|nr:hypothetical protein HA402_001956 [Bradysia odoriphaga]